MLEFRGHYASCIVYTDEIEEEAVKQIYGFLSHPAFENLRIRIMPDVHAGSGAVIGFTSTMGSKVIPNVIGVDIGCGVLSSEFRVDDLDFQKFDDFVRENIPSGFGIRNAPNMGAFLKGWSGWNGEFECDVELVCKETGQDFNRVMCSLGTLGGGNHFIEVGKDSYAFNKWITVHSGSRNFGLKIAKFHQDIAKKQHPHGDLSYLEGPEAELYLKHMSVAQKYASINRKLIVGVLAGFLKERPQRLIESVHNFIDDQGITRKGAIAAHRDQWVVIPWNMRDGLVLGVGKGNEGWNNSAPHGAGRKMCRREAKRQVKLEDFQETMKGVWTSCVNESTLDESPFAYKDSASVEHHLEDTVDVKHRIRPLYNFKASE